MFAVSSRINKQVEEFTSGQWPQLHSDKEMDSTLGYVCFNSSHVFGKLQLCLFLVKHLHGLSVLVFCTMITVLSTICSGAEGFFTPCSE